MNNGFFFKALFEPRAIAFIGASANPSKWGFNILHHLLQGGFTGNIYPINPQGGSWFDLPVYKDLSGLPRPVDMAVIVVPNDKVADTLRNCKAAGITAAVVITAGFSETGAEGKALEQEVVSVARKCGIRLVGPNTMGIFSAYPSMIQAVMPPSEFRPGAVAVLSQSGNLGTSIIDRFLRRGIGLSRLVSTGNEADLTTEDYLDYLATDEKTQVVCLYLEGVRQGSRFIETARRISATKPLILLKGGTGSVGARAALSHTGALAGSYTVFKSICSQANIIAVETIDEMINVAGLLLSQPELMGKRIGIVTQGGGLGVISADMCEAAGLEVPALSGHVVETLDAFLPPFWSRRNPVDLVAPGKMSMITDSTEALLKDSNMDAILLLGMGYMAVRAKNWLSSPLLRQDVMEQPARTIIDGEINLMNLVIKQIKQFNKPIIPVIDVSVFDMPGDNIVHRLDEQGIMAYSSPEQAISAIAKVEGYYRRRRVSGKPDRRCMQAVCKS